MAATIGDRLVLQVALAALIADRAIERVVDQQEFHHAFARGLDHRAVGADVLIIGGGQRARCLRLGRPRLHLDQAHAAIARDAEALMVTETRYFLARSLARLEHGGASGHLHFDSVYGQFGHYTLSPTRTRRAFKLSIITMSPPLPAGNS